LFPESGEENKRARRETGVYGGSQSSYYGLLPLLVANLHAAEQGGAFDHQHGGIFVGGRVVGAVFHTAEEGAAFHLDFPIARHQDLGSAKDGVDAEHGVAAGDGGVAQVKFVAAEDGDHAGTFELVGHLAISPAEDGHVARLVAGPENQADRKGNKKEKTHCTTAIEAAMKSHENTVRNPERDCSCHLGPGWGNGRFDEGEAGAVGARMVSPMSSEPFVHLHCHTDYSLLDGACEITRMMDIAAAQKMPAIAMTDHGNLFGAVEFYNAAKAKDIIPIIGCEVYVAPEGHKNRADARYNHLVLLAENQDGYRNLIQMVSTGFLEGFYYKPRIDKDLLARHSKGIIALSACLKGDINEAMLEDRYQDGKKLAYEYQDIFGKENFFLELQDHGLEQDKRLLPMLYRLGQETGMPLVASNDAHYLSRDDARAHEILLCIQTGKTLSDEKRMKWDNPDFYLKTRAEMELLFGEVPEALDRTWDIAQRCKVKLEKVPEPFPKFDVPEGHSIDSYFDYVTREGFERRRGRLEQMARQGALKCPLPTYYERLDREIKMIQQMKFPGYFLVVWDFIRYSKAKGIPVGPGRGSAAGSLVAYALAITDIDPMQYDLLFERFLNPERISMPDIDIDFCTNRRGEVIQYVTEKYGRDYVAQIITFGTMGAKAAIKDVGRVLDMTYGEVEKLTKLVPAQPLSIKLKDAFEAEPGFGDARRADARVNEVLEIAVRLEGMARNASMHAAGVVIASTPLRELVPVYKTNRDEVVTQYDMSGVEKLGLLKMDFLGLTTLTIVHNALELIQQHRGVSITVEEIGLDDDFTYEKIFSNGYTSGIFQFESPGMRDILRRYKPNRLTDLIALNALYRPGPMKMIDDFIDRKHGRKPVTYETPELEELLSETYGVMVYQEQVMQISNRVAGYSLGEADMLRRAMGKKDQAEMAKQRERFQRGAAEKSISPKKAEKIFDLMAEFANYGFNKSHSAAYAYLAYITAYLKAHYPVEFMSALLTSETGNTTKVVKYINECRDMQIRVLAPDVNESHLNFTPAGDAIRFGLGAIKNVGANAVHSIIEARQEGGRFPGMEDFCERVDMSSVNKRAIESFIKAGAMDELRGNRAQLFASIEGAVEAGQRASKDRESGQGGLFGEMLANEPAPEKPLPDLPDWTQKEKLVGEKEMLGFYITGHPLDEFRDRVSEKATHNSVELEGLARGADIAICGVITGVQRRRNQKGELWSSFQLEDWFGAAECMCFAKVFGEIGSQIHEDQAVLIRGQALPEEGVPAKVSVKEITPLANVRVSLPRLISIKVALGKVNGVDRAEELTKLFALKPGEAEVRLRLEKSRDFAVTLDLDTRVRADKQFFAEVERICGPQAIEVLAD
jgi:DNA polymerase III subunit alpha